MKEEHTYFQVLVGIVHKIRGYLFCLCPKDRTRTLVKVRRGKFQLGIKDFPITMAMQRLCRLLGETEVCAMPGFIYLIGDFSRIF